MTRPDVKPSIISRRLNAFIINKNHISVMNIFIQSGINAILVKNPKNIKVITPNSSPDIFKKGFRFFISSIKPSNNIIKEDNITPDNFIAGNVIKNRLDKTAERNAI
jgi:hypothetical protein